MMVFVIHFNFLIALFIEQTTYRFVALLAVLHVRTCFNDGHWTYNLARPGYDGGYWGHLLENVVDVYFTGQKKILTMSSELEAVTI